jgi:hypothetical protein
LGALIDHPQHGVVSGSKRLHRSTPRKGPAAKKFSYGGFGLIQPAIKRQMYLYKSGLGYGAGLIEQVSKEHAPDKQ